MSITDDLGKDIRGREIPADMADDAQMYHDAAHRACGRAGRRSAWRSILTARS
ncbi:MAG: hypothetical protein ACLUHE_11240 [Christensenellales bacterium]